MSAAAILIKARESSVEINIDGDKIVLRGPRAQVQRLRPELVEHKTELLRLLREVELPARVRQRLLSACGRLGIDATVVAEQFDAWRYCGANLKEMSQWSEAVVEAHCRLLADEATNNFSPWT